MKPRSDYCDSILNDSLLYISPHTWAENFVVMVTATTYNWLVDCLL